MASHLSSRLSWFRKLTGMFALEQGSSVSNKHHGRRGRGFEILESRTLLSVDLTPSIAGIAFHDLKQDGLTADDIRLNDMTINLFRDGGNGTFDGKALGGDDSFVKSVTTDSSGNYRFDVNLSVGTYFVQQAGVPGLVIPAGRDVAKVTITSDDFKGVAGTTIDSFGTTSQLVSDSLYGGKTTSSAAGMNVPIVGGASVSSALGASEAIGGYRKLSAQRTSQWGSVLLGANANIPGALEFASGSASTGTYWVGWDGQGSNASTLDPTGLGQKDLTSLGTRSGIKLSLGADHDNVSAVLKIYSDANNWSMATISPVPNTGDGTASQEFFLRWTSFVTGGGAGADFTKVGAIRLDVTGTNAVDGQVGPIGTLGPKVLLNNFIDISPDLGIVKSVSSATAIAGNKLTYTFTTTNYGPADATGVTITDTLPAGLTYVSSGGSGAVTNVNGTLTVSLGALANGASATTTILVAVDAGATGSLVNTATVSCIETDPNPANNTYTVTTPITTTVDLEIAKSGTPDPVKAGKQLTYTLTVTNHGPSSATGVTVVDTLPAGVTYVSSNNSTATANADGTVSVSLGALAVNASTNFTIVVSVGATTIGPLTNTAVVSGHETESNMTNNTATCKTNVDVPVIKKDTWDLGVRKSGPATATTGTTMTYTLLINNYSTGTENQVTVNDTLPAGVELVSATPSQGTVDTSNGIVASLGAMAQQAQATITIVVRVTAVAGATILNTATVSGDADKVDADASNNTAHVTTSVYGAPFAKKLFVGRG